MGIQFMLAAVGVLAVTCASLDDNAPLRDRAAMFFGVAGAGLFLTGVVAALAGF